MPGRNGGLAPDYLVVIMLFGSFIGVSAHGFTRFKNQVNQKNPPQKITYPGFKVVLIPAMITLEEKLLTFYL